MDYDQACRILNLNLKHTQTQLKKAYHIAALKNHPDKNKDKENANTQFQEISAAYGFLLNNHSERYCYVNHDISYKNLLRKIISEFDPITLDGHSGEVFEGIAKTKLQEPTSDLKEIIDWCKGIISDEEITDPLKIISKAKLKLE